MTKVQASKPIKRGRPQGGKGTTRYPNLHQWHDLNSSKSIIKFIYLIRFRRIPGNYFKT
jgi:hypothetical protein